MSMAKALTLWQPWASLIAAGIKKVETRPWMTHYRGPLLIHAAKFLPTWNVLDELLRQDEFRRAVDTLVLIQMRDEGETSSVVDIKEFIEALPRGAVVAKCELVECGLARVAKKFLSQQEIACGYYEEDQFAWMLDDIESVDPPVPVKGKQRLWTPPEWLQC